MQPVSAWVGAIAARNAASSLPARFCLATMRTINVSSDMTVSYRIAAGASGTVSASLSPSILLRNSTIVTNAVEERDRGLGSPS